MGDGVGIIPSDETVYAPADAVVTSLIQDSKHAVGLTLANGMEILIHVGVDTVEMKGEGFTYLVSDGQKVRKGDALMTFSKERIAATGHPDTVLMIVTEEGNANGVEMHSGMEGSALSAEVVTWN